MKTWILLILISGSTEFKQLGEFYSQKECVKFQKSIAIYNRKFTLCLTKSQLKELANH